MGYTGQGDDTIRLDKSIVIDLERSKAMEASGEILPSDGFVAKDRGETSAPGQFMQETVDAETARKMAAAKGITLSETVDGAVNDSNNKGGGGSHNNANTSKMPSAILESFRKKPPMVPEAQTATQQFDPNFIKGVQEANNRLNKAGGEIKTRIPQNATRETLNEYSGPESTLTSSFSPNPSPQVNFGGGNSIDYSVMAALMKDAVREVIKEVNIKDIVREVLKEEKDEVSKQKINENIEIRIGASTFGGKIISMDKPKK